MGAERLFKTAFLVFVATMALGQLSAESRPGTMDVILLIDKSLSMAEAIAEVKAYAAGEVIEAILVPGDRLIIEAFYGKVERTFAGTIRSEADKTKAVRSLNEIAANGSFTDIGAALDRAKLDLVELGSADRPKYVHLLTDERQEAPPGSPYQATNYVLVHPALTWVKRLDLGKFRAITVGLDVEARLDQAVPGVMKLLTAAPIRKDADFPPLKEGSSPGLETASSSQAASADTTKPSGSGGPSDNTGGVPLFPAALFSLLILAAAVVAAILWRRKKKRDEERHDP